MFGFLALLVGSVVLPLIVFLLVVASTEDEHQAREWDRMTHRIVK